MTEDCARRRVHASNRRSRLLASRRNAGGNLQGLRLLRPIPILWVSPFLFRPGFAGPPSPREKGSLRSGEKAQAHTGPWFRRTPRRGVPAGVSARKMPHPWGCGMGDQLADSSWARASSWAVLVSSRAERIFTVFWAKVRSLLFSSMVFMIRAATGAQLPFSMKATVRF